MNCKTIDDILKYLEEQENQGCLSVTSQNQIQTLKFQLRCMRIFVKWVKDNSYLYSIRAWIEDVEMRLLHLERKGSTAHELLEEALSSLSTEPVEKKIQFECYRYFELGFSILSFGLYDHSVQIDELVLDCIDPLLETLTYLSCCNDLNLTVPSEKQIAAFVEKLRSLRNFIMVTRTEHDKDRIYNESWWWKSRDLLTRVKKLVENAIFVSCDSWSKPINERIEELCFCLVVKIKHLEPEIRMSYAQFWRVSANPGNIGIDLQALASVDSLLDNIQKLLKDQVCCSILPLDVPQIEFLYQELTFLKYFLMHPHLEQYTQIIPQGFTSLLIQVEAMARRASLAYSMCVGQIMGQLANEVNLLHLNMLKVVNLLKVEIRKMHQAVPNPSISSYPLTPKLAFLDYFLQSLDELEKHKANSVSHVKNEIKIVRSELRFLSPFVSDTIKYSKDEEHIARCVVDVAYEAEHVIDLISASNLPNWYYMLWLSDVIEKMKMLRKDLTEVETTCNVSMLNVEKASIPIPKWAYNVVAEELVVGFHDEAEKLIDRLTSGPQQLDIVSIVGVTGLGKTTLAKIVYEHPFVSSNFHVRSWCYTPQEYAERDLLLNILGNISVPTEEIRRMNAEEMSERLYRRLKGWRYLIIIDDIWDIRLWHYLRISFPDDNNGSRILLTSRFRELALQLNPRSAVHDLRLFTEEESWELLKKKVFQQRTCPPELYTIGKKIAKHCSGLPLSVLLVAGILMNVKESETHWRQISESLGNQVSGSRECRDILEASYKYLPDHLKPCFLYLGAFSNYKEIPAKKLIHLWVAEGFVQKTKSESSENVAEGYLMDLIARSLVFIAQNKSNGGVKSCGLCALLHEFSLKKAKDENIFLITREMVDVPQQYWNWFHCKKFLFRKWMAGELYARSVFFPTGRSFGLFDDLSILPYMLKLLRVLDLEHTSLESDRFPTGIEQMVHLRYLAIQGCLKYVPPSVANLWRLETFLVKVANNAVVNLPETLLEMAYLKDVCVNMPAFQLPDSFQPEKSFESSGIEKLSTPKLCHGSSTTEKLIRRLTNLRKLKCIFLNSADNRFPVLDMLSTLESLNVTYHDSRIPQYPCEFSFPSNLKKLTLSEFPLPWSEVSKIGRRLPKLEVLKLLFSASEGRRWNVSNDEFLNLKFLKLEGLNIAKWDASPNAFPCLEQLVLQRCAQLKEVPSSFGESTTLQMIKVQRCGYSVTEAVRRIHKEQEEVRPDELKVFIQSPYRDYEADWNSDSDS